jgi:hypothetical protein
MDVNKWFEKGGVDMYISADLFYSGPTWPAHVEVASEFSMGGTVVPQRTKELPVFRHGF